MMTSDQAITVIRQSAYAAHADALIPLLAPSIRVEVSESKAELISPGISYLGGDPHLPSADAWPIWDRTAYIKKEMAFYEGHIAQHGSAEWKTEALSKWKEQLQQPKVPLGFIGQLNLSDVNRCDVLPNLPSDGLLLFFYDREQGPWGFDPRDRGFCRVLYFPPDTPLKPISPPVPLPDDMVYHPYSLSFSAEWTLPDYPEVVGDDLDYDRYQALLGAIAGGEIPEEGLHRIYGHPETIQREMQLECQLVHHGLYCGDGSGYKDPRAKTLEAGAVDWKLLLQVDTHEEAMGWMWGDCGRLYFWGREEETVKGNFENAWCILQCY